VHHAPDPSGNAPIVGIRLDKYTSDPSR
jgi:hypothetical protein